MSFPRLYQTMVSEHLAKNRQMLILSGPRQVGKTTLAKSQGGLYFNFEQPEDRRKILDAPAFSQGIAQWLAGQGSGKKPVLTLDELHKHNRWKNFLKGLFDEFEPGLGIIVTGSSRLELMRRGGDSLMGRYFVTHVNPLSVAELMHTSPPAPGALWRDPQRLDDASWQSLLKHGGFPEPLSRQEETFTRSWQDHRRDQLIHGDLRDLSRIRELSQVEALALLLDQRSASTLNYSHLASDIGSNVVSVRSWVAALANLHQGFTLSPWSKKVASSLRREPKWYSRDWSTALDKGARFETLVANHLLKAVQFYNDSGRGRFELHYIRTRQHEEVDFLVSQDQKPWLLVEAKHSETTLHKALPKFQAMLKAPHAVQVVESLPFENKNAFASPHPIIISARDFLSQLI